MAAGILLASARPDGLGAGHPAPVRYLDELILKAKNMP